MKNRSTKKRLLVSALFMLAASVTLSCHKNNDDSKSMPNIKPHYLLSGVYSSSSGCFDYYDIGNNEYAVSLNDNFVSGDHE